MIQPYEQLVTVFGGGGFIGRYVAEALLKSGVRVRIASRNPRQAYFIQPLGQVGQFGFVKADVTRPESVRTAMEGATAAVNLTGTFKNMHQVHADGARNIAEAARDAGADSFVHMSAIGADPESEAVYGRSKAKGEAAVRAAFPGASIFRPSLVFGPEDRLTNMFANLGRLPVIPVIAAKRRFQPVFVRDLAQAIAKATLDPERFGGQTFEIGGPQVMTMRQLQEEVLKAAGEKADLIDLPDAACSLISRLGFLPGVPLNRDQWLMLQRDNVPAQDASGLEAFGIEPSPLGAVAPGWLARFAGNRFAMRRVNFTANT